MTPAEPPKEPSATTDAHRSDVGVVAKGGAVQIAGQVSQRGLSFLFGMIAARVLLPAGYGLYRQVAQVLAIGGQLGLAGFNYAAMRFMTRARVAGEPGAVVGAARVGLTGAAIASTLVVVAVLLGADELAALFSDRPELDATFAHLFRIGVAYIPLFALQQVLRYATQSYKTMVPSVVAGNIVQPVARFLAGAVALALGFEVAGAVVSLSLSFAAGVLAAAWYLARMMPAADRKARTRAPVGQMTRFALLQGGSSLLGIQSLGFGILILGALSTDRAAGLFAIALALQGPGGIFLGGIVNIWAPVVADLYDRGEIARLGAMYQTITRWIATFSFPVFAALAIQPELFIQIFSPRALPEAAPVVAILALGNFFYTGTGPVGYVLSMTGRPGINLINSVVGVAVYIGLGLWVVPEHGILGMAIVDATVTAGMNLARVIEAWIFVGVQPFGRSLLKPVAATAGGAAALGLWRLVLGTSIPVQIGGLVVAAVVYALLLRAFGMDEDERYVWNQIRRRALRGRKGGTPTMPS